MSANLAAVVMAGGLGTRMRSSVPKHLHPLLGRRVVDWVIEGSRAADGSVETIVEERDATDEEKAVRELNSSIYVFEAAAMWDALGKLEPHNAQGELYLTDAVGHIVAAGGRAAAWVCPDDDSPIGI